MKVQQSKMKGFMWTALILVLVFSLAACSGSNTGSSGKGSGGSNEKGKIVYYAFDAWLSGTPDYDPIWQELIDDFHKDYPNIEVEFQDDPWGSWVTNLPVRLQTGNAPDVFLVNNPDFPLFAQGGYLMNLDPYFDEAYFSDYFPGVLSMYQFEGKPMAIPYTTDARVLWYNEKVFEEAGLDPNDPPQTYEELLEAAKATTIDRDGDGAIDVYGFGMHLAGDAMPIDSLYLASEGNIIDSSTLAGNTNTDEFKDYLQLLVDMKPYYQPDHATKNHLEVAALFGEEKVAMVVAGLWVWKNMDENADFYRHAMVPRQDENAPHGSFGGGFGLAVAQKSKHPEAAARFAELMTSPKYHSKLMTDFTPSHASMAAANYDENPRYEVLMEQIKFARQSQNPKTVHYKEIDKTVNDYVEMALNGELGVEETAKILEEKITEITSKK
jgi:multiple sugar transport system substrate-binding protein